MAGSDPNMPNVLATLTDFNNRFALKDAELAEVKKEVREAKESSENLNALIQRNVVSQLADFKIDMQMLEVNVKNEFVQTKATIGEEFEKTKAEIGKQKAEIENIIKEAGILFANNTAQMNGQEETLLKLRQECLNAFDNLKKLHDESEEKFKNVEDAYKVSNKTLEDVKDSVESSLKVIEQSQGNGGGKGDGGKGTWEPKPTVFIKAKDQMPDKLDADASKWRDWKESFLSYADTLRPGMKAWLKEIEEDVRDLSEINEDALKATVTSGELKEWVVLDRENLWRGVRGCTTGEARKITESTQSENGYEAWLDLCKNFEPAVKAKKGAALADVYMMTAKRAKNPNGN